MIKCSYHKKFDRPYGAFHDKEDTPMSIAARRLQSSVSGSSDPRLYLSPASGSYSNGSTLVVIIMANSYTEAVNAVQANLTYPTSRMTFVSIDTSHSNFTTTIQSTGGSGSVQVGVGVLASSLTGAQEVARVTFTLTSTGSAAVAFAAGSGIARASDATDVCKKTTGATYTIT